MLFDPGALDISLTVAVGEDPQLRAELRRAFLDSAMAMLDRMADAPSDALWFQSALRLKGLAGSFGANEIMRLVDRALDGAPRADGVHAALQVAVVAFAHG
jgi:hypothetical protein